MLGSKQTVTYKGFFAVIKQRLNLGSPMPIFKKSSMFSRSPPFSRQQAKMGANNLQTQKNKCRMCISSSHLLQVFLGVAETVFCTLYNNNCSMYRKATVLCKSEDTTSHGTAILYCTVSFEVSYSHTQNPHDKIPVTLYTSEGWAMLKHLPF